MSNRILVLVVLGCAACSQAEYPGPLFPPPPQSAALTAVGTCDDLDAAVRKHLVQQMDRLLEEQFRSVFDVDCPGFLELRFGGFSAADEDAGDGGGSAREYTTTNVQVGGVDEPDLVKNDGSTIYLISGDELLIIDAWPAEELHVIGRVAIEGIPKKLFVHAGRAVVYADEVAICDYGYSYRDSDPGRTLIHVLDIQDPTHPSRVRTVRADGRFVAGRLVGDAVHTVLAFNPLPSRYISGVSYYANVDACDDSAEEIAHAYRELREKNVAVIDALVLDAKLPRIVSERIALGEAIAGSDIYAACGNLYDPDYTGGMDVVTLLSFSIGDDTELSATGILGGSGEVYANAESVYVATSGTGLGSWWWHGSTSVLHKLGIHADAAPATYRASGAVTGYLVNQFSMDELDGYLRVAVTQRGDELSNALYVLGEEEGRLEVVGAIEGIAETEDIRSVRFDGPRGFIVTFKKTDPLFALDLANPREPRIRGELKIPEFSTYMHLLDDEHLLTIGYDADDQGDFAWFTGVLLQIFDVSDMRNPRLTHRESIGTRGTSSAALDNHLTFFRERGQLAVPMVICEGGDGDGNYGDVMTFNGLLVYDVSAESGISLRGSVDHGGRHSCYNWWQQASSSVQRSLFMEDYVYSVSGLELRVNDTRDFASDVSQLSLAGVPEDVCY